MSSNKLNKKFDVKWAGDITYIKTGLGWHTYP